MGEIQKYKDLIRQRVADGDLEELAADLLKAAVANNGNWAACGTACWPGCSNCRRTPGHGSPTAS